MKYKYETVLLKLSGEALKGKQDVYSREELENVSRQVVELAKNGLKVAIVVGGGNIWRGRLGKELNMPQINADYMGMLATVMNGLALESTIKTLGYDKVRVYSSLPIKTVTDDYNFKQARIKLDEGYVSIFVGGTGFSYFTTDTNAVIRAIEINADAVLMAKNGVKGVYNKDPRTNADAKFFSHLTYDEIAKQELRVMDLTAATLAKEAKMTIEVFDMQGKNNIVKVLTGEIESTKISL